MAERIEVTPALRFPALQGQRGLAALAIVAFHAYQYDRSGAAGTFPLEDTWAHPLLFGLDGMVDWFFVLSAFLLTVPLARALRDGRSVQGAKDFLGRRSVRIVPLYLVAVLVVWASRNSSLPGDWRDLLEHLTFTQVYDRQRIFYTIGPAWSLAVEVHFYVLVAVLCAVLGRVAVRRSTPARRLAPLVGAAVLMAAVSLAWVLVAEYVLDRPADDYPWWFSLPPKLAVFAVGILVAVLAVVRPAGLSVRTRWLLRLLGVGGYVVACLVRGETGAADALFHLACALAFAALVYGDVAGPQRGLWHRICAVGFLPWVGMVSYSLYLWHEPLLLALADLELVPTQSADAFGPTLLILLATGLLVAWVSYWVIEYPASHLRFFLGNVPSRELEAERRVSP